MVDFVKLHFRLAQDEDGYPPVDVESVWAKSSSTAQEYEIDNIPFYVREVACGDLVRAKQDTDGSLWFDGLVKASGHSTVRLLFARAEDVADARAHLRTLGCSSELSDLPRLVSVDIPPDVAYDDMKAYFDQGEAAGTFEYEEACLGFLG